MIGGTILPSTAPRKPNSLTAAFVKTVQEPGKYHDGKGTGLFLWVKETGGKFWIQRMTIRGKRCELGLGCPPVVSLAEAREQALENKRLTRAGGDPLAEKRRAKRLLTFEEAARRTHAELAPTWKNQKDRKAYLSTLQTYVFPRFGHVALPEVTSADVRQAILAAREKAPGVAKKLVYRISFVFKWGIAEGLCASNPATTQALALPRDAHQTLMVPNDLCREMPGGGWRRERFTKARAELLTRGYIVQRRPPSSAHGPAMYSWSQSAQN